VREISQDTRSLKPNFTTGPLKHEAQKLTS
jgi:hypothetical protein